MKHLPNLLTLANLFCGCIAIAYILTAQPYTSVSIADGGLPSWRWVYGAEQICWGSIFIFIAAICDLLDGTVARALKVFSPIGKDLDSLADVVSFGVAPFLIACFAALRLAKFNITADKQKSFFIGMPTPAVGLFVASFPLVLWYAPANYAHFFGSLFQNEWVLYIIIGILCWLMVSRVKFIKLMPAKWNIAHTWPQIILIIAGGVAIPFMQIAVLPFVFILYVLLSFIYKQPQTISNNI